MSHRFSKAIRGMLYALMLTFLTVSAPRAVDMTDRQAAFTRMLDAPCQKYHLPKLLVMAIARQESGYHPWCVNIEGRDYYAKSREQALQIAAWALRNDKSFDVGLMQINSYWIKKYRWPLASVIEPKYNVMIGCWILAQEIRRHGYNWKAIAYYHTPLHRNWERGVNYARSVVKHIRSIQNEIRMRQRSTAMPVPDFNQSAAIASQAAYTRTESGVMIRDLPGENIRATLITDRVLRGKKEQKKDPEINLKAEQPRTLETLIAERVALAKKKSSENKSDETGDASAKNRVVAETQKQKMREVALRMAKVTDKNPASEKKTASQRTLKDLIDERIERASETLLAERR